MELDNAYALIIGVSAYHHIYQLPKSATDAQDLYDVLSHSGYPSSNVHLLMDENATKQKIDDELSWLAHNTQTPNATAFIFFSGHGIQQIGGFWPGEYLCPIEAIPGQNKNTLISNEEMIRAINAINATRLTVFLDACHAGGIGELRAANIRIAPGLSDKTYINLAQGSGRVIIASSLVQEQSHALSTMRNSLFTHFLLQGLRGFAVEANGAIYITKLFSHIRQGLNQYGLQRPFQQVIAEDFVIAYANASLQTYYDFVLLEQTKLTEIYELFTGSGEIVERYCNSLLDFINALYWSTERLHKYLGAARDLTLPDQSITDLQEDLRGISTLIERSLEPAIKKFLLICCGKSLQTERQRGIVGEYLTSLQDELKAFTGYLEKYSLVTLKQVEGNKAPISLLLHLPTITTKQGTPILVKNPAPQEDADPPYTGVNNNTCKMPEPPPKQNLSSLNLSEETDRNEFLNVMHKHFKDKDLRTLCSRLVITYDDIKGEDIWNTITNIIDYKKTPEWSNKLIEKMQIVKPESADELIRYINSKPIA